jgi:hypothetical protein
MARLFAVLLIATVLLAHHSTAAYDLQHPATATGYVTRFDCSNPHAHIFLDVLGPNGAVEHWVIEIDSPNALQRVGWNQESIKRGDKVTCSGARAKDGSPRMRCTQVELGNGTVLHSF